MPFDPSPYEVMYTEALRDEEINACIVEHLDLIRRTMAARGRVFVYLPLLGDELTASPEVWRYRVPWDQDVKPLKLPNFPDSMGVLNFMSKPQNVVFVGAPCLVRCTEEDSSREQAVYYRVQPDKQELLANAHRADYWEYLLDRLDAAAARRSSMILYSLGEYEADKSFDHETEILIESVRHQVELLRRRGISEALLRDLVLFEQKLSRLHITADYRIFLTDYQNREVLLTPLPKAVFLLFLRHPEGIRFKELPDYREELRRIYADVLGSRYNLLSRRFRKYDQSVQAATDPFDNSINEKCARIREAFLLVMHDDLACRYYITGPRGEPKRITLPRDMVDFDAPAAPGSGA